VGGHTDSHVGINALRIFDPLTRVWSQAPNMAFGRWYPTNTALPDGRQLVLGGETTCNDCNALLPEIYNPSTNQVSTLNSGSQDLPYYPHVYVLPDGRVFVAANAKYAVPSKDLNLTTQTVSTVDANVYDGGSSVMYLPGKIMKSGTSHDADLPPDPSSPRTFVIDMTAGSPHWTETAPMAFGRTYHTLTVLPDGNVLATGGGSTSDAINSDVAVYAAELWSPSTQTGPPLASGQIPGLYHPTALLLPDGRVLVGAGGRYNGSPSNAPYDRLNAEIYSPPYLFKGARPTITSAPGDGAYGASIS